MTAAGTDERETREEETTLVDEEWPVAEQYRVTPTETPEDDARADEETATVLVREQASLRRRPRPPFLRDERLAGIVVALILALALAALTGWFLTKGDEAIGTTTPTEQPSGAGTTTADTATSPTTASTAPPPDVTGTVSGEARIAVPDVIGATASAARRTLEKAGLRVEIERIASSRPSGTVLRQSPEPRAELENGSVVSLQVAEPRPTPQTVGVPRLTGLDVSSARSRVRELGLRSTVTRVESNEPEGTVVAQDPSSGTALERGGIVALSVSSGPASVPVPDVVGIDEGSARTELESAGFDVRTIDEPTDDPTQAGLVVGQSPAGGAERKPGTVVTVRVARLA